MFKIPSPLSRSKNIPPVSVQWNSVLCHSSSFTCKSQRSEFGSVYNNCLTTEVPFGSRLQCYCCSKRYLTSWPVRWVSSNAVVSPGRPEDQRATAHTIIPSTYHLLICFTFIHLKAFAPGRRPVKPHTYTVDHYAVLWRISQAAVKAAR